MPLRSALGALALLLAPAALAAPAPPPAGAGAFINEFHYDNDGADANEFVEVAVFTGVDVGALTLTFYNGSNGMPYEEVSGSAFVQGEAVGGFTFYTVEVEGIQNGSPDGIALSLGDAVQEFLSYEGTLTAADGPADGLTSTDVGVEETSSTLATESLQRTGDSADGFTWTGPAAASPGALNAGQTLDGSGGGGGALTIAEARAAGVGETVTVRGVVSRALGDYLYLQDATGGLSVRQTSGDLFDDVADGTVGPGTALEVTGELSEFNGQLQINAGDLDAYAVLGAQAAPAPRPLAAAEIAEDGEDYEGQLVRVEGVTVVDRGTGLPATGNFFDSTSYGLDDGSGDVLTLRIPNADDTEVEGTPIPEGPVTLVGVVGEFGGDYQLLLLSLDDIDATGGVVPIAEARAAGVGATVTIEGVITRARGAFSYVQDDTGALAIRQLDSDYAMAIESGDLGPGSRVRITGTLSEFRASLQINQPTEGNDLTSFVDLGDGDLPEPQTVTLDELAQNGEDYEDELVRVEDVQIQGTGDFMAATTYGVSDGSGAGGLVTLRVPNADDTTVDETPIPAGPVAVVGILGQFSVEVPDAGYQLLVIEAADVNAEGVAAERDPAAGLSLEAPNPVRGAATVRFGLEAPGRATLALYDALGRRVATLADGPVGLDASAALDARDLAAGVYVLRLSTEAGALTRTLTVVR